MNVRETILGIIELPRRFNNLDDVSIYSLLKGTGYFENHSLISESAIHEALTHHPECIHEWMLLSEDQRSDVGWYFRRDEKAGYEVGYFPTTGGEIQRVGYSNSTDASAAFIKRQIENIRTALP